MVIQQKVVVQSHLLVHVQGCVGMESRALAEGSVDVEQRGWRNVSRGGKGRLGTVIHWGHCCPGTAVMVLEEPGGYRGKREFPMSPPKAKGLSMSRRG